uniref:Bulb-type lectin domain-containing protein n=1 Tax=Sander lucioperca TaxID=283035 RepID=A0A8C9ZF61_SANLU
SLQDNVASKCLKMHTLIAIKCLCFCLQDDGNFVIYGWKPVWASDTCGSDVFRLCMQADCNLVMYNKAGGAKWQTNSHNPGGCNMCRLHLTNDGTLVVYKESDEIWSSANSRGEMNDVMT